MYFLRSQFIWGASSQFAMYSGILLLLTSGLLASTSTSGKCLKRGFFCSLHRFSSSLYNVSAVLFTTIPIIRLHVLRPSLVALDGSQQSRLVQQSLVVQQCATKTTDLIGV